MTNDKYEFMAKRKLLNNEIVDIQNRLAQIDDQLANKVHHRVYASLMSDRRKLGVRKLQIQNQLTELKQDRHLLLNEAFLNTCIEMLDPQDITEIWDRLYVNHPELSDKRI